MKIFKTIGIVVITLILLFLLISFFLPKEVNIEESILIKAPSEKIFNMVNNTRNWEKWNPFTNDNQSMKIYYDGPEAGVGATIKWEDADEYGQIKIIEVVPNGLISGDLLFENKLKSKINWYFESSSEGTFVIWNIVSKELPYPFYRWLSLFAGKMIRPDLQKGLSNLKELCEIQSPIINKWTTSDVKIKNIAPFYALSIIDSCNTGNYQQKFDEIFRIIFDYVSKNKIKQSSFPFCVFHSWNPDGVSVFEAGIPVNQSFESIGRILFSEKVGGKVVYATQFGPYESTSFAHSAIDKYIKENNLRINGFPWEVYITDTKNEPDTSKWETQIYYPVE